MRDEREQGFELVIAVRAARADVEREVDLCGGGFGDHRARPAKRTSPAKAGAQLRAAGLARAGLHDGNLGNWAPAFAGEA